MKKSLVLASLLALGTSSFAMEVKPFVGLDLSNAKADYSETLSLTGGTLTYGGTTYNTVGSYTNNDSSSDSSPAFKAGIILDNTHRIYAKYASFDGDYSSKMKLTTFNYDYMFSNFKNDYKITPYVGAFLGQGKIDTYIGSGTGAVYGAGVGAIVPITESIEFDFSFAYMKSNVDVTQSMTGVSGTYGASTLANVSGSDTIELKNATIFSLGFNYKF